MSPRPGGEAAKFGARFEGRWTVKYLIDVLMGRADSVTVEPVDPDTDSVEFLAVAAGREQAHQAKRQWRTNVTWPVSALREAGVLAGAAAHVARGREFHFTSTLPARTLDELTDAARRSEDYSGFAALIAGSKRLRDEFDLLANEWRTPQDAHTTLQHVYVWKPDERHLYSTNVALAEGLIEESPDAAVAVLADIVLDNLGVSLTSAKLWRELEARGLRRNPLYHDKTLPGLVGAQTTRWLAVIQRELLQPPIEREETDAAIRSIREEAQGSSGRTLPVRHGEPVPSTPWHRLDSSHDCDPLATDGRRGPSARGQGRCVDVLPAPTGTAMRSPRTSGKRSRLTAPRSSCAVTRV